MDLATIEQVINVLGLPTVKLINPWDNKRSAIDPNNRFIVLLSPDKQVIRFYIERLFNSLSFFEYQDFKDSDDTPGLLINRDELEKYLVLKLLE